MIAFGKLETVVEDLIPPCFQILSRHLTRVVEENHEEN
jgi:hypothetical protein